jgi:hypothetical protein
MRRDGVWGFEGGAHRSWRPLSLQGQSASSQSFSYRHTYLTDNNTSLVFGIHRESQRVPNVNLVKMDAFKGFQKSITYDY